MFCRVKWTVSSSNTSPLAARFNSISGSSSSERGWEPISWRTLHHRKCSCTASPDDPPRQETVGGAKRKRLSHLSLFRFNHIFCPRSASSRFQTQISVEPQSLRNAGGGKTEDLAPPFHQSSFIHKESRVYNRSDKNQRAQNSICRNKKTSQRRRPSHFNPRSPIQGQPLLLSADTTGSFMFWGRGGLSWGRAMETWRFLPSWESPGNRKWTRFCWYDAVEGKSLVPLIKQLHSFLPGMKTKCRWSNWSNWISWSTTGCSENPGEENRKW